MWSVRGKFHRMRLLDAWEKSLRVQVAANFGGCELVGMEMRR